MIAEQWEADAGESLVLDDGSALWERLCERIAPHFGRVEVQARLKRSLARLLTRSGTWDTADARYRRWRRQRLWPRPIDALGPAATPNLAADETTKWPFARAAPVARQ